MKYNKQVQETLDRLDREINVCFLIMGFSSIIWIITLIMEYTK